ncbi:mercury resistance system transport protein MerF [Thalassospira profundimaris]|uniref:mercury resistance system transport protein MerF n=1 Tax=Thalassospira profundimaris TaxID=502049 RepID=UPI000DEE1841|nr:mercury resistance system transport protein MerF [Thalassospira profundimaris]
MNDKKLLRTGSIGAVIAAICCFTPALVVLVGFVGLSAIVGWLDYGLFPILFASMGLIAYALYLRSGRKGPSPTPVIVVAVVALSALLFWLEFRYALRISIAATLTVAAYAYYLRACVRRQSGQSADTEETVYDR